MNDGSVVIGLNSFGSWSISGSFTVSATTGKSDIPIIVGGKSVTISGTVCWFVGFTVVLALDSLIVV